MSSGTWSWWAPDRPVSCAALGALKASPGLRVLLLDRADFPRDKSCGDGIAPHVLDALASVGAADVVAGWTPLRHLELARGDTRVAGPMAREVYVVPREVFDARLVERAVAAGAVLEKRRVRRVEVHRRPGRAGRRTRREGRRRRRRCALGVATAPSSARSASRGPSPSAATPRPPKRVAAPRSSGTARVPSRRTPGPSTAATAGATSGTASCCPDRPAARLPAGRCCSSSSRSCCRPRSRTAATGRATTCRCRAGAGSSPTEGCCSSATPPPW